MADTQPTNKDLDELKRFSLKLRLIAVAVSCVIIVCIGLFFKHQANVREQQRLEEIARMEENNRRLAAEQTERDRLQAIEIARQQQIADSIRIANMPSYSIADVYEMIRSKVPAYSWVYLWRKDNDNWIMKYTLAYGDKEHHFIQRFNPTTRKFEKAIEYSTTYYKNLTDDRGVYTHPKNVRCSFTEDNRWGTLDYYEDGNHIGVYNRRGIENACRLPSQSHGQLTKKRINALESAPPEWKEEGYESWEDWYYDNEEDLHFYYGR